MKHTHTLQRFILGLAVLVASFSASAWTWEVHNNDATFTIRADLYTGTSGSGILVDSVSIAPGAMVSRGESGSGAFGCRDGNGNVNPVPSSGGWFNFTGTGTVVVQFGTPPPTTHCSALNCINMDSRPWDYNIYSNNTSTLAFPRVLINSVSLPPGGQYQTSVCGPVGGDPFVLFSTQVPTDGTAERYSCWGNQSNGSVTPVAPTQFQNTNSSAWNATNPAAPVFDGSNPTNIVYASGTNVATDPTLKSGFSAIYDATSKQTASEHTDMAGVNSGLGTLNSTLSTFSSQTHTSLGTISSTLDSMSTKLDLVHADGENLGSEFGTATNQLNSVLRTLTNGFNEVSNAITNSHTGDASWTNQFFANKYTDSTTIWANAQANGTGVGDSVGPLSTWGGDAGTVFSAPGDSDLGQDGAFFSFDIPMGHTVGGTELKAHFGPDATQAGQLLTTCADLSHRLFTWILCFVYVGKVAQDIYRTIRLMAMTKGMIVPNLSFSFAGFGGNMGGAALFLLTIVAGMGVYAIFLATMFTSFTSGGELDLPNIFSSVGGSNPLDHMGSSGLSLLCMFIPVGLVFGLASAYLTWRFTVSKLVAIFSVAF